MKEFTPDVSQLKKIHKAYKSWKKADTETLLRNNNNMRRVQATAKTMAEAGGKEAIITRLIYAEFNSKQVDYYWDMKSKDKKALEEGYEGLGFEDFKMSVMESALSTESVLNEAFLSQPSEKYIENLFSKLQSGKLSPIEVGLLEKLVKDAKKALKPKFKIAAVSTEKSLNWNDAIQYAMSLGKGWRLPTMDELDQIYLSDNDFAGHQYWASDNGRDAYSACYIDFGNGDKSDRSDKGNNYRVRAIKA